MKPEIIVEPKSGRRAWLKRIGAVGFLFFLIKGLLWLVVVYGAGHLIQ